MGHRSEFWQKCENVRKIKKNCLIIKQSQRIGEISHFEIKMIQWIFRDEKKIRNTKWRAKSKFLGKMHAARAEMPKFTKKEYSEF